MRNHQSLLLHVVLVVLLGSSLSFQWSLNQQEVLRSPSSLLFPSRKHHGGRWNTAAVTAIYSSSTSSGDDGVVDVDDNDAKTKAATLKRDLLALGASYDRGFGASPSARNRADTIIRELEVYNTETEASRGINGDSVDDEDSPLRGIWRMIWTTASDVLVLGASPVATVGAIYQIFDPPVVTNVIDFLPRLQALLPPSVIPSSLIRAKVQTKASLRPGFPNRVGLLFEAVKLQPVEFLGMDATKLPPFAANLPKIPGTDTDTGPGYFDVSYLDDELLIIRQNAPGGLFALVKVMDSEP